MFTSIVAGVDGSTNAEQALGVAASMAKLDSASLHVVTAYRPLSAHEVDEIRSLLPDEFRDLVYANESADAVLARARHLVECVGVNADFHERSADPTDVLLDAVDEFSADLLVVGSRRENAAQRMLHGSVSTKVLHHAPCSVLVVKEDPPSKDEATTP